ncbi:collagen-binding domain-containing protein [[Clostridium] aminophilum]|uniref:collagen-binding domain-containing protein n=1 Tax=[Clostridium] aminophilum TaxID=1526 RepID=UPI00068AFFA3|nr:collagen-binding domain-containing protein [[Clostridium] aminophilum]
MKKSGKAKFHRVMVSILSGTLALGNPAVTLADTASGMEREGGAASETEDMESSNSISGQDTAEDAKEPSAESGKTDPETESSATDGESDHNPDEANGNRSSDSGDDAKAGETTEQTGEDHAEKKMTNADDYREKTTMTIDKDGELRELDSNSKESENIREFMNAQNVTSDFAVYGKELKGTIGHEDGNIAVEHLDASTCVMNKEGQYAANTVGEKEQREVDIDYARNGYSYIGSASEGVQITSCSNAGQWKKDGEEQQPQSNNSKIVLGENASHAVNEESGAANHFSAVVIQDEMLNENGELRDEALKELTDSDNRFKNLKDVMKFDENLEKIGQAGQKLIDSMKEESSAEEDLTKLRKTAELLEDKERLGNDSILAVTVGAGFLACGGSAEKTNVIKETLNSLIKKNDNLVNILINVVIDARDVIVDSQNNTKVLDLSHGGEINRFQGYDGRAACLTWNFGSFDGVLKLNLWSGNILAPLAQVEAGGDVQSGRIVGSTIKHTGEVHMAVKGTETELPEEPIVPEMPEEPVVPSEAPEAPSEEPVDPSEDPVDPSEEPTYPSEDPVDPSEDPTVPSEEPTVPSEEPTLPSEEPVAPSEDPVDPSEEPTVPSEEPVVPSEDPVDPSEEPTVPSEKPVTPAVPQEYPHGGSATAEVLTATAVIRPEKR